MMNETKAFLAIWHGLLPKGKFVWEKWHTCEHMPERIGIPGFLRGSRYMNYNDEEQCCFTIYEGSNLNVFKSKPYLERLNNPTLWTNKNASTFINFTRGACRCISTSSRESDYGGFVMTIRFLKRQDFRENLNDLEQLTNNITKLDGIIGATIGICEAEITSIETTEKKLRKGTFETSLDGVLLIEGYDQNILKNQMKNIQNLKKLSGINIDLMQCQIYSLSYILIDK